MTEVALTLHDRLRAAAKVLQAAGIEDGLFEARLLMMRVRDCDRAGLMRDRDALLSEAEEAAFEAGVQRRAGREPMAHILGRRGFWTLDLKVTPETLDPRPDTETLVAAVLDHLSDKTAPLSLIDLGTGSGCILLSLLAELPKATGVGVDQSDGALTVAAENAAHNGLDQRARFQKGDWLSGFSNPVDVIVSNPPYIPSKDIADLAPEVRLFEPLSALDGGADGLDPYRIIVTQAVELLTPGGLLAFEVGIDQSRDVMALCQAQGLEPLEIRADFGGVERVVLAVKPPC